MKQLKFVGLAVVALVLSGLYLVGCGHDSGTGLLGSYNAKIEIEVPDVVAARNATATLVKQNHGGRLEREVTENADGKHSALTFRVPADQFEAVVSDLQSGSIEGTVTRTDLRGFEKADASTDLGRLIENLNDRLTSDEQQELERLAGKNDNPTLVVELSKGPGFFHGVGGLLANRLLWVVLAFVFGLLAGRRRKTKGTRGDSEPGHGTTPDHDPEIHSSTMM